MELQRARYANYYARCKIYEELSNLWAKLIPPSPTSLSQDKLQSLGIQCSGMASCPEEEPDSSPRFCTLVPPSTMSNAFDSIFPSKRTWWPGSDPEDDSNFYAALALGRVLLDYFISGQDIQEPLIDTEWYTTGQWGVHRILRVNNTHQPHLACVHIDDALPEEGLRPSELISTIKLMKQAIRLDKRAQYCVHPVRTYVLRSLIQPPD
ncbi:MAG: hypothetical protein Q9175_007215 [Cornicularia normoerica]